MYLHRMTQKSNSIVLDNFAFTLIFDNFGQFILIISLMF